MRESGQARQRRLEVRRALRIAWSVLLWAAFIFCASSLIAHCADAMEPPEEYWALNPECVEDCASGDPAEDVELGDLFPGWDFLICGPRGFSIVTIREWCMWRCLTPAICAQPHDVGAPELPDSLFGDERWIDITGRRSDGRQARGLYFLVRDGRVIRREWRRDDGR